jgi:hypothetical protein
MVSRNSSPRSKKSVSLSVMLGTLLVPLSAYAASSLVETSGVADSVTAPETSPVVEPAVTTAPPPGADLETACGEAGLAMVAAETAGTISQLQQAALDALRGICAEQGMPLPAPAAPQPVATQPTPPSPTSTGAQSVVASEDDEHHGRHGGDDDDEDDHGRHGGDDDDEDDHGRHGEDHD